MRVLLTGASGLLGTWLIRSAAHDVTALVRRRPVSGVARVEADLTDARAVARAIDAVGPDLIVHTAYRLDRASIVDATAHLAAAGVPIVLTSTDAVFPGDGRVRAEEDEPDPVWDYGRWKVEAERIALAVPGSAVVRLPLLISLDPPDATTAAVAAAASEGRRLGWYDGETRMPAWASEIAACLWRIASVDRRDGVWHLMGPDRLTRAELGARIADRLGVPDPGDVVPPPPFTERPRDLRLSDERARREVDWSPTPVR